MTAFNLHGINNFQHTLLNGLGMFFDLIEFALLEALLGVLLAEGAFWTAAFEEAT